MTKRQEVETSSIARLHHNLRLTVDYRLIEELRSYGRALRKRSKAYRQNMLNSVSQFGIVLPILIDEQSTIIAGEGVVAAARGLGLTEVPTTRIEHLDGEQVRLLRMALNKIGEQSVWDMESLTVEFGDLLASNIDINFDVTGFATPEIDNLLYPPKPVPADDPDDSFAVAAEPDQGVTRMGDLWLLGRHRVLCASCREASSFERLMAGAQSGPQANARH